VRIINDGQSTLFDLDQYQCESLVKWGWLEDVELGSDKNLLPNSKHLLPNSPVREQMIDSDSLLPNSDSLLPNSDSLLPNSPVREQIKPLPLNWGVVKVKGRSYFLTPTKRKTPKLLPKERTWYDIKTLKGNQYLYLRWRQDKTQKSRLLGRIDELKYSE
jgi:hypothetical protein